MYFYYIYATRLTKKDKEKMDNRYATVRDEYPVNVPQGLRRISNKYVYEQAENYEGCAEFMWAQYQTRPDDEPILFVTNKEVSEAAPLREKDILFCFHLSPLVRFFIKLLTSEQDENKVSKAIVSFFYSFSKAAPSNLPDSVSSEVKKIEEYFQSNWNKSLTLKECLAFIGRGFAEIKKNMEAHLRTVKSIDKNSFESFCRFIEEDMKDIEDAIDDVLSLINDKKIQIKDAQISYNADDLFELRKVPFSFPLFSTSKKAYSEEEKQTATSQALKDEKHARGSKKHKSSDKSDSTPSLPPASSSTASLMLMQIAHPSIHTAQPNQTAVAEQIYMASLAHFQAARGLPVSTVFPGSQASMSASLSIMPPSSSNNNNTPFGSR